MSSPFFDLVKAIRSYATLPEKVNGIVAALERMEEAAAPFARLKEGVTLAPSITVKATNTSWMLEGQSLVIGLGQAIAYFYVDEVLDEDEVVLARIIGDPRELGTATIPAGAIITPGVPGKADNQRKADLDSSTGKLLLSQSPSLAKFITPTEETDILNGTAQSSAGTGLYHWGDLTTNDNPEIKLYTRERFPDIPPGENPPAPVLYNFIASQKVEVYLHGARYGVPFENVGWWWFPGTVVETNGDFIRILLDNYLYGPNLVNLADPDYIVREPVKLSHFGLTDGMLLVTQLGTANHPITNQNGSVFTVGSGHTFTAGMAVQIILDDGSVVNTTVVSTTESTITVSANYLTIPVPTGLLVKGSTWLVFTWSIPGSANPALIGKSIFRMNLNGTWLEPAERIYTGSSISLRYTVANIQPGAEIEWKVKFVDIYGNEGEWSPSVNSYF